MNFETAKASLLAERRAETTITSAPEPSPEAAPQFNTAVTTRTPQQMARVEAIKKQTEIWRQRHPGKDFGRDM